MIFRIPTLSIIVTVLCFVVSVHAQDISSSKELFPFLAEVTSDNVHVRAGQSENFESLSKMKLGDEVVILGRSYSWYKIGLPIDAKSYISQQFVKLQGGDNGVITGNRVNIRAGAGINFTVLGQLNKNDGVDILAVEKDWIKIRPVAGSFGWIRDSMVAFKSKTVKTAKQQKEKSKVVVKAKADKGATEKEKLAKDQKIKKAEDEGENEIKNLKSNKIFIVTGFMKEFKKKNNHRIRYQLFVDDKPAYLLNGPEHLFERFLKYKVSIEGKIDDEKDSELTLPIISVSKLKLVL